MPSLMLGLLVLLVFGLVDDIRELGYRAKFTGQMAAALVVVVYGGVQIRTLGALLPEGFLLPGVLAIPLTVITIVGVTNAINLADGLDGLAGGICLLAFCCIGYLAYLGERAEIALLCVAIGGAIIGFLRYNTHPATIFMGDTGSQFLGFTAVTLSLALTQGDTPLSPILPLVLLGFPVLDTLTVMFGRTMRGQPLFKADKSHFHHKLMILGLYHTEAVFVVYVLQALLVSSAFFLRFHSDWLLLSGYLVFSGLVLAGYYLAYRTGWKLKRYDFIDRAVKGRLRVLKEKDIPVKVSFRTLQIGIPALLVLSCFVPATLPRYFSLFFLSLAGLLMAAWLGKKEWGHGLVRPAFYLCVPVVIFMGQKQMAGWLDRDLARLYNLSFGLITLFILLVLRFTRRQKGFHFYPLDFLILFLAVGVANLPAEVFQIPKALMPLFVVKVIVLFYGYEVLAGELRGDVKGLGLATLLALGVLAVRGWVG